MQEFFNTTRGRVITGLVVFLLVMLMMVSCSRPVYQTSAGYGQAPIVTAAPMAPPVTVVNGGGGGHSGIGDFVSGAAVGALAGHMLSNRNQPAQQPNAFMPQYQRPATVAPAQRYVPPVRTVTQVTSQRGITTASVSRPSTMGTTTRQSVSVGRSPTPTRR